MNDENPAPILSVEERLRVCLTLTKGLFHLTELAAEHAHAELEHFEPRDVLNHVPDLTQALRDQLLAVRGALPFECLSRPAPTRPSSKLMSRKPTTQGGPHRPLQASSSSENVPGKNRHRTADLQRERRRRMSWRARTAAIGRRTREQGGAE